MEEEAERRRKKKKKKKKTCVTRIRHFSIIFYSR